MTITLEHTEVLERTRGNNHSYTRYVVNELILTDIDKIIPVKQFGRKYYKFMAGSATVGVYPVEDCKAIVE